MPRKILVPLDGSEFSEQSLKSAYKIAELDRATVHLVRVVTPGIETVAEFGFSASPALEQLRADAQKYLDECAERSPRSVVTHSAVLSGPSSIAELLAYYVVQARIDLVVMSTHARTGLGRFWIGSEADALVRMVNVPVLLLRPHREETGYECDSWRARHILIPLDGSVRAEAAIEAAVELGWLSGARYTLMQVVPPPALETYADVIAAQLDAHEIEHELEQARDYLESVAEPLRRLRLPVETVAVVHPNIAAAIVHYAAENKVDMVALGTHGRGGWSRLASGSVTQDILHSARLPMIVLHAADVGEFAPSGLTAAAV